MPKNIPAPVEGYGRRVLLRVASFLAVAFLIGSVVSRTSRWVQEAHQPAGFGVGVVQGALMPMALPNLLCGRDVPIYSQENTGVSYKLGYTTGVNVCGLIFFGVLFWRINRWRGQRF